MGRPRSFARRAARRTPAPIPTSARPLKGPRPASASCRQRRPPRGGRAPRRPRRCAGPPAMTSAALFLLLLTPAADPDGVSFFEKKIRPVLVEYCYKCHSAEAQAKKKLRGALRLDTREGLLVGGDTGPAIVPGKAKD